ncbi:unnamed protein product, partial [Miscanthus lutarioriparius]
MRRPRPKRVKRRIDAAIDHLAQYGFAEPQIRNIINNLLQLAVAPFSEILHGILPSSSVG